MPSLLLQSSLSQYLRASDSATLSITGSLTIEFLVYFNSLPASGDIIQFVDKYVDGVNQHSYALQLVNISGSYFLNGLVSSNGSSDFDKNVAWTPSLSTWYHVAFSHNTSGEMKFYINASQQGATQSGGPTSIFNSTAQFFLGSFGGSSRYLDGYLDEIRIWSEERSAGNLSTYKNVQINPQTANLNAYYRLNNSLADLTGNKNTLTAFNTPSFSSREPFAQQGGGSFII